MNTNVLILDPYLYLGPCSGASSKPFLASAGITHILSIGATPSEKLPSITYERIRLIDSPTSDIGRAVHDAKVFIDAVKAQHGRVFVHCSQAISRSPTVVAAYLMQAEGMSLKAALGRIVRARPAVSPNPAFVQQLKAIELELYGKNSLEVDEMPRKREDRVALFAEE
ncbi:phosphatases II [Auriscalpium vulgare]|uniref:Phosphatases II n=1 Tax=Auriscalpium vulgare TaxID=40419 RepID=A0ACB8RYN1_9AGAM|nr:phosphatases II [Auriscalpium vulgare]